MNRDFTGLKYTIFEFQSTDKISTIAAIDRRNNNKLKRSINLERFDALIHLINILILKRRQAYILFVFVQ